MRKSSGDRALFDFPHFDLITSINKKFFEFIFSKKLLLLPEFSFGFSSGWSGLKKPYRGSEHRFCPVMVNPYQGVCLFPIKSPKKQECIWFNPQHIEKTKRIGNKTEYE
ncbi:competence protein ComK [Neobacillus drentensis]|uniref:competence protein ComK n=1 Tax=Neobacillus drentensis TaxID=220684 RepID=UPI003B5862D8